MTDYYVSLDGCDDSTPAKISLTDAEAAALLKVADVLNRLSVHTCQPEIEVKPWENVGDWDKRYVAECEREALARDAERDGQAGA